MNNILGISAGFHDAAAAVIDQQGDILFAAHSERYSKIKNDPNLHANLLQKLSTYNPLTVAYYERPFWKSVRRLYNGEAVTFGDFGLANTVNKHLQGSIKPKKIVSFGHHLSHAAAGFQTSPFSDATVVVIDAIGEWDTISVWSAKYIKEKAQYKKLWSVKYPHSIGLFYSAMTKRCGLLPQEEEYILMGMSAYGDDIVKNSLIKDFIFDLDAIKFSYNFHLGIPNDYLDLVSNFDLAASAQSVTEKLIRIVMKKASNYEISNNLVYAGGVALNCVANRILGEYFNNIWIMPCPGDAGSSIGAAALAYGKKLNWHNAYLGHNIEGEYPVNKLLYCLLREKIVGVASGPAEFGPRALGNRSLLADPRLPNIKDMVNAIKQRENFRPFAPVILEEYVHQYFKMPLGFGLSPYMQTTAICRDPKLFPAIVHIDGSSRVQTVAKDNSGIRLLLEAWHKATGCPMLLNTSLNIKGRPIVNDLLDAKEFEKLYNVTVCS